MLSFRKGVCKEIIIRIWEVLTVCVWFKDQNKLSLLLLYFYCLWYTNSLFFTVNILLRVIFLRQSKRFICTVIEFPEIYLHYVVSLRLLKLWKMSDKNCRFEYIEYVSKYLIFSVSFHPALHFRKTKNNLCIAFVIKNLKNKKVG